MRRESLEDLPNPEVPDGLELRTFRAGDGPGWARLMTGAIGDWDQESTTRLFLDDPGVKTDGIYFLVTSDDYIASATDKQLPGLVEQLTLNQRTPVDACARRFDCL